jgi:hypothetical protein
MKHLTPFCAAALVLAQAAQAAPLCDAFLSADAMPAKYRKLAPVLSGAATDWIITQDQLDQVYAPPAEALQLLGEIAQHFEARGTKLAILMPPPRPLIAGQAALDGLTGGTEGFDVETTAASFNQMIAQVNAAGVLAPNLLARATEDTALRDAFYYRHDTHWTPRGATESAVALAEAVLAADLPAFSDSALVQPNLNTPEVFSERGSLADMAAAVCGAQVAPVSSAIPAFPKGALGLLEDTGARPQIILAGSSFSNRYKRDAYRVADAIGGALQADVINHSVSGGGAIAAIEGIVNAKLLTAQAPVDLVVWELPYTEGLRNLGMLRQLLGALQMERQKTASLAVGFDASGKTTITLGDAKPQVLALHLPNATLERVKVDLRFADVSKQTLGLVRKSRVPSELRSDWWAVSLFGLAQKDPISVTIRYNPDAVGHSAQAHLF